MIKHFNIIRLVESNLFAIMATKKVRTILGTMEFGRRLNLEESKEMAQAFYDIQSKTGPAEFDSAFMYGDGKTEEYIGQMDLRLKDEVQIATKANSLDNKSLDAAGLRMQLETSLKRLKVDCVQIFYLHAPDHKTPIIETLRAVNDLFKEKKFREFGLSNYAAWQVAEIHTICKNEGWVQPTVYEGIYNPLTRSVERELFKCLRYFNMRFYAYSPLCGGMLTGKHKIEDSTKTEPGRFFGKGWAEVYRFHYWKPEVFDSISKIQKVLNDVYGNEVSITEASLRWMYHHSQLDGSCGDGVLLGASSMKYFNINMSCATKGPLDEKVVKVYDECWNACSHFSPNYMM